MTDLIDRENLYQDMAEKNRELNDNGLSWAEFRRGFSFAIEFVKNAPSIEPKWRWIPVTESLPEDGERVLITHKGGVSFGWYNGSYWERGASTNHRPLQTVIAWISLPEPYRGEE